MKSRNVIFLFVMAMPLLISACRPYHATPFDALTEWPGKLEGADSAVLESVQVLKEEEVSGGWVILYSIPSKESGENVLVSTFVTLEGSGWRAQSSGWKNYSNSDDFVFSGIAGGNITDLSTASGISNKGETVRIEWSDGQIDIVPIEAGSFIFSRPETLSVRHIELLDGSGNVLESMEFGTMAATESQGQTETPGEVLMATPTSIPDSPTRIPMNDITGMPQIDPVIEIILSNDITPRRNLVHFTTSGCTHAMGMGGPPKCEPGQEEGTPVEHFPILGHEGGYKAPEEIDQVLDFHAESLYAAFRHKDEPVRETYFAPGVYVLIFTTGDTDGTNVLVHLNEDGEIVRLDTVDRFMALSLEEELERMVAEWLIGPP